MDIKKNLAKVAVSGLAVGILSIAGVATAAFADDPGDSTPSFTWVPNPTGGFTAQNTPTDNSTVDPNSVIPPTYLPYDPNQYYYGNYPYGYQNYPVYPTYTYAYGSANQLIITGASETLGIPYSVLASQLAQGWTLTQIAQQYGYSRDYFLSILVPRVQSDVIADINNGTVDPGTGNALIANLLYAAGSAVDTPYLA